MGGSILNVSSIKNELISGVRYGKPANGNRELKDKRVVTSDNNMFVVVSLMTANLYKGTFRYP